MDDEKIKKLHKNLLQLYKLKQTIDRIGWLPKESIDLADYILEEMNIDLNIDRIVYNSIADDFNLTRIYLNDFNKKRNKSIEIKFIGAINSLISQMKTLSHKGI